MCLYLAVSRLAIAARGILSQFSWRFSSFLGRGLLLADLSSTTLNSTTVSPIGSHSLRSDRHHRRARPQVSEIVFRYFFYFGARRRGYYPHWAGVKLGRIPTDLRSGTSYLRSTTCSNRSCTPQLRSDTFLLGFITLHSLYLSIFLYA